MNNVDKLFSEEYQLLLLTEQHIETLYNWNLEEKKHEYYSCRPIKLSNSFEEYSYKVLKLLSEGQQKIYVLVKKGDSMPLGKITLFDLNSRNRSGEFGYYLPKNNRALGLGNIMVAKFIETIFKDESLNLNKIYGWKITGALLD